MAEPATDPLDDVLARVRATAGRRDQRGEGLGDEVGWLREIGVLAAAMPASLSGHPTWSDAPPAIAALLRRIGAASLPLGRVFEGHVNALQLIGVHAHASLGRRCAEAAAGGALFGVWGADGATPMRAEARGEGFVLTGAKRFCSGLGLVEWALVSAWMGDHTRLFCVDVRDAARADDTWQVSGMRATCSGGYDFADMALPADAAVGGRDAFYAEPHFLGGMYRMCAVQVGGLDALLAETAGALRRRGKADDALAHLRLGQIASFAMLAATVTAAVAARLERFPVTRDHARLSEAELSEAEKSEPSGESARRGMVPGAGTPADAIAREAVLMREGVERCITEALAVADRALGTEMHHEPSAVSCLRRDLSVYIRQAAVDERLAMVGRWFMAPTGP